MIGSVGSYATTYTYTALAAPAVASAHSSTGQTGEKEFSIPESALVAPEETTPAPNGASDNYGTARAWLELAQLHVQLPLGQNASSASASRQERTPDDISGEESGAMTAEEDAEETEASDETSRNPEEIGADGSQLSEEEQQQVRELADRDREVRTHEQAHQSVGGQYAGGMSLEYEQGPDGNRYAVGGEVSIDTSPEREPEATIRKMQQVRAAALAPAEPSGQDRSVAGAASAMEAEARGELAEQRRETIQSGGESEPGDESGNTNETADDAETSAAASGAQIRQYAASHAAYAFPSLHAGAMSPMGNAAYRPVDVVA